MCLGAIYWARPRASSMPELPPMPQMRALMTRSFTKSCNAHRNRGIPMIQLMREESLAVFAAWKQQPNKTQY